MLGPTRANIADSMGHAENARFWRYIPRLGHIPQVGPVLGSTLAAAAQVPSG